MHTNHNQMNFSVILVILDIIIPLLKSRPLCRFAYGNYMISVFNYFPLTINAVPWWLKGIIIHLNQTQRSDEAHQNYLFINRHYKYWITGSNSFISFVVIAISSLNPKPQTNEHLLPIPYSVHSIIINWF
jgi:hypothetical protein